MKRTEPKSITTIIEESMAQAGVSVAYAEQRACFLWPDIVGPGVNRYTLKRYVDHGVLHVHLTSAPLKQELSFQRDRLIDLLNKAVGSRAITAIMFH